MGLIDLDRIAPKYQRLVVLLVASNLFSLLLFALRVFGSDGLRYYFMLWNLFLAWLPLLFAVLLMRRLAKTKWLEPICVGYTALWLAFLPNSFYVITDLIHLQSTGEINILFDTVMFSSFIFNACVAGFLSVYLVHHQILKRWANVDSHFLIGLVFLLCGYAIYLGRSLRWNSWDLFVYPTGILFDVSEGFINPLGHPQLFVTTATYFGLLSIMYAVLYQLTEVLRDSKQR